MQVETGTMNLFTLLECATMIVLTSCESNPVVETPAGTFMGHVLKTRNGRDISSFEGIPYAKPPTGELRFKDPVLMPKLDGVYNATNGYKDCYQPPFNMSQFKNISLYTGTEDCLYLNVHTPKNYDGTLKPLPVLVWIHGGAYFLGSGSRSWNGPGYLLDKDMILVTVNYRLGILGYLYDGRSVAGNFGMKDQAMAMKWVQNNIAAFGGDPKSVTIAGESAGGSSVSLQMHSPLSKGLFSRAIAQSGTIGSAFAVEAGSIASAKAKKVIEDLGCSMEKGQTLKCLQKISMNELYKSAVTLVDDQDILSMDFIPVLEEPSPTAFMTLDSLKEPSAMPFMVGVTSEEALFIFISLFKIDKYHGNLAPIKENLDYTIPLWGKFKHISDEKNVTEAIIRFYFGEGGKSAATETQIIHYLSDIYFNFGAYKAAKTEKGPTYFYKLSYKGKDDSLIGVPEVPSDLKDGVGHADDLRYLFTSDQFQPVDKDSPDELSVSERMVDYWYNFVLSGNPTKNNQWEESVGGIKYADIVKNGIEMKTNMFKERMEFLDNLNIDQLSQVA